MLVAVLRGHKFPLLGLAQPAGHQLTRLEVLVNQPGPGTFEIVILAPQVWDVQMSERRAGKIIIGEKNPCTWPEVLAVSPSWILRSPRMCVGVGEMIPSLHLACEGR